jgi:hypothetical protein
MLAAFERSSGCGVSNWVLGTSNLSSIFETGGGGSMRGLVMGDS